jgi:hypothetical protein
LKEAAQKAMLRKYQFGIAVKYASVEPMNLVVHSPFNIHLPPFASPLTGAIARKVNHAKSSTTSIKDNSPPISMSLEKMVF